MKTLLQIITILITTIALVLLTSCLLDLLWIQKQPSRKLLIYLLMLSQLLFGILMIKETLKTIK